MLACLCPNGLNRYDGMAPPRRLFVATASGISVLERDAPGQAWHLAETTLAGVHVMTLAIVAGGAGLLAGTHGDGIFFSAADGKRWESRNEGMSSKDVYSLAAIEQDGGVTLYAGTQPASLFRSRDLGRNWVELPALRQVPSAKNWTFPAPPHLAHTKMMVFDPRDPNTFYVAIEQGALLLTRDGGASWRELNSYSRPDDKFLCDVHQVLLLPSMPETLFMSTGVGLYKSLDAGEIWERLTGRTSALPILITWRFRRTNALSSWPARKTSRASGGARISRRPASCAAETAGITGPFAADSTSRRTPTSRP
jgi:photosystem II stability/assembly factor-like uncharacterized protein